MKYKSTLMDSDAVKRALKRISFEILEKNRGTEGLCLVGIRTRGVCVAEELRGNILRHEGTELPCGVLDISLYRDDLTERSAGPAVNGSEIGFDVTGRTVILADDVIFTGRTARAAIEAVFALGRPRAIQLAVLIDRGHRELPIKPDYVGKNIPTSLSEVVKVSFPETDGAETAVKIFSTD